MPTVSVSSSAYQDLAAIRERIDYEGSDIFSDNEALRFDELLVRLEQESRGIFETLWGDETPLEETGRTDVRRATDDAALALVYPITDVTKVEIKRTLGDDWDELDSERYDHTEHRLVLAAHPGGTALAHGGHRRTTTVGQYAARATWADLAAKLRVTYDRGFGTEPPNDIKSIQIDIINKMLRQMKREQTVAAASPEELAGITEPAEVVTEEIRDRVQDVTSPGRATMSV